MAARVIFENEFNSDDVDWKAEGILYSRSVVETQPKQTAVIKILLY